jgi:hypothetical protein
VLSSWRGRFLSVFSLTCCIDAFLGGYWDGANKRSVLRPPVFSPSILTYLRCCCTTHDGSCTIALPFFCHLFSLMFCFLPFYIIIIIIMSRRIKAVAQKFIYYMVSKRLAMHTRFLFPLFLSTIPSHPILARVALEFRYICPGLLLFFLVPFLF